MIKPSKIFQASTIAFTLVLSACTTATDRTAPESKALIVNSASSTAKPMATAVENVQLSSIAHLLATRKRHQYVVPGSNQTRCNIFVRDFMSHVFDGNAPSEFSGTANTVFAKLNTSTDWEAHAIEESTLEMAQQAANAGQLAVIGYKNNSSSGHLAVVVPSKLDNGAMGYSRKWGMPMPFIAQAGTSIFEYKGMNWGFAANKRARMKVFIYRGAKG